MPAPPDRSAGAVESKKYLKIINEGSDNVLVRAESKHALASLDSLIFDLDGVVIDPTLSIESAHPLALGFWAERFLELEVGRELIDRFDVAQFKLATGFNDDWNIAAAAALVYAVKKDWYGTSDGDILREKTPTLSEAASGSDACGGGVEGMKAWLKATAPSDVYSAGEKRWDPELVMQLLMETVAGPDCREMYGFDARHWRGKGTIANDKKLLDERDLDLPFKIGVYTGRTLGEVHVGFRTVGLEGWIPDDRIITVDEGMPKPDGRPLRILLDKLCARRCAFIGDNRDDLRSVQMCRDSGVSELYSIQVCFADQTGEARGMFLSEGADMVAPTSRSALRALLKLRKEL